jgi:diguanylate cyclase (GGDEF)-like protein
MLAFSDPTLVGAGVLLGLLLAGLAFRLTSRRTSRIDLAAPGTEAATTPTIPPDFPPTLSPQTTARRMCIAFESWLAQNRDRTDLWPAFDQLLRELLTEHIGATRVRCYHVSPDSEMLQTIAQTGSGPHGASPSLREGLLGHVATSGTEYVAGDASVGPLVHSLNEQEGEAWTWVWPVRSDVGTKGVVAAGNLRDATTLTLDLRETVGQLITLFWEHVSCLDSFQVVRRTDQASGVLTRNDFFARARHIVADSYHANEPVVIAVLALEGLRRMDDGRLWTERDALIVSLGEVISSRVRSDDIVGRFADDRFVLVLRRLDSGLGRLIAEKLLQGATESAAAIGDAERPVTMRMGLAGSGFHRPSFDELLAKAFEAVDRARHAGQPLASDLEHEGAS